MHLKHQRACRMCASSRRELPGAHQSRRPVRSKWLSPPPLDPHTDESDDDYNRMIFMQGGESSSVLESLPPLTAEAYHAFDDFSTDAMSKYEDTVSGFFYEGIEDLKRRMKGKWPLQKVGGRELRQSSSKQPPAYRYRYSVEGDEVVDMIQLKKRTPRAFDRPIDQRIKKGLQASQSLRPASSSGGGYLADGFFDDESELSLEPSSAPLNAFLYCITRDEIFAGLWELGLADRIEFVPTLDQADVLIHRRPRPREKQFSYQHLLRQAQELGVPFCSINEPTKRELRASLIPVFDLYAGALPFDLDEADKRKGPRRIRI